MARFASQIVIAGIVWSGCKGLLQDGDVFVDSDKGSTDWALDSTPYNDVFNTAYRGAQFGIELGAEDAGLQITKVNQTLNAIKQGVKFPVLYTDEQYILNLMCKRDYSQKWYSHGKFSEGYVKGVTFRFVVDTAISVALSS